MPERLQRIHQVVGRAMDAKEVSGAVTVVARKGQVTHFEAHGLMDIESKKAMSRDAIFPIASMSKPITGVAILMLVEEASPAERRCPFVSGTRKLPS
jgi:CubicO group peptidase (beta-lactamase class C family)